MENELKIKKYSFNLDCKAPNELAGFYAALLKWESRVIDEDLPVCMLREPIRIVSLHTVSPESGVQTSCVAGRI